MKSDKKKSKLNEGKITFFKCDVCDKIFGTRCSSERHMRETCSKEKFCYKCDVCEKIYRTKCNLNRHMREACLKEKLYHYCCKCYKRFVRKDNLHRHEKFCLTGEMACYECSECSSKFTRIDGLKRHKKTMHMIQDEQETDEEISAFKCDKCSNKFTRKDNLQKHIAKCYGFVLPHQQCDICGSVFAKDYIKKHKQLKHFKENLDLTCDKCGTSFTTYRALTIHLKKHLLGEKYVGKLNCALCSATYLETKEILDHIETGHYIEIEKENYNFPSISEFNKWKLEMEKSSATSYVKQYKGVTKIYTLAKFTCHRSGSYVPKMTDRQREFKVRYATKKTGCYCPAEIKLREFKSDGSCLVSFIKTHMGHDVSDKVNELQYTYLSKMERMEIASKISSGVPFNKILIDNAKSLNSDDDISRLHVLNKKDLHNIASAFQLRLTVPGPFVTDCIDVETFVAQNLNSILYYKRQNELCGKYPSLDAKDIIMVIMTDSQREFLLKYGHNVIMIDGTFELNRYNFLIHTLLVLDDDHEGLEAAFVISNRNDPMLGHIFFESIKESVGTIQVRTMMTDIQGTYYDSWSMVMEKPEYHLFCTWHVREAWRTNLTKITNIEKRNSIRNNLIRIASILDERLFKAEIHQFVYNPDPDTQKFLDYFVDLFFKKNLTAWPYCYRRRSAINMNIVAEAFHGNIKNFNGQRQKVGDLISCVNLLNNYLLLKKQGILRKSIWGKITQKLGILRKVHKEIENKDVDIVVQQSSSDQGWFVTLSSKNKEQSDVYFVCAADYNCENCMLYCRKCDTCLHQFVCTCEENSIKYNMCKHIHALCTSLRSSNSSIIVTAWNNTNSEEIASTNTEEFGKCKIETNDGCEIQYSKKCKIEDDEYMSLPRVKHETLEKFKEILKFSKDDEDAHVIERRIDSLEQQILLKQQSVNG